MDTHMKGPVNGLSEGAIVSQRGFHVVPAQTVAKGLMEIEATPKQPVVVEITPITRTAFDAGTMNVGTPADEDAYVAGAALNAVGFGTTVRFLIEARTKIQVRLTGAPTSGRAVVLIRATGLGNGVGIEY